MDAHRTDRIGILRPLRIKDFRLLWAGLAVSLIGDGIFFVAIAWEVYRLENAPTALSTVLFAFSVPHVMLLLVGGVLSDRIERRRMMIFSDVVRGLSIGAIGLLSVTGALELWHVYGLIAIYGAGEAFFGPAFGAIVPDIVPRSLLVQANSLNQFIRPLAVRLIGPAIGGAIVATLGGGEAFLLDAATFGVSAIALALMSARPLETTEIHSARRELREGFAFVRRHVWLWGTLLSAAIGLLAFVGPFEVLLPFIVKNRLEGSAADLGAVFVAGGAGAITVSLLLGQRGLPRRHIAFMYVSWAVGVGLVAMYSAATAVWQALLISAASWGCFTAGTVVWGTLMHTLVPRALLGRVTSVDWLVSFALAPLSYAATGPIAEAWGAEETLATAGVVGALVTLGFLFLPGMRDTESDGRLAAGEPGSREREEEVSAPSR